MSVKKRVAVLASGGGSNLEALLTACQDPSYPAEIALVVSNVPTAGALERARRFGAPTQVIAHKEFQSRDAFDAALAHTLGQHQIEWVCLAGFMRLLGPAFLHPFRGRILNIHPALLPAFPGAHAQRQAIEYGVKVSGCTVHFVDEGTDTGPIIAQSTVPVLPGDDEASLSARILSFEHRLYPEVLRWVCEGRVRVEGRRVTVEGIGSPHS